MRSSSSYSPNRTDILMSEPAKLLLASSKVLYAELKSLPAPLEVWGSYNPLEYAWDSYSTYVQRYGNSKKKVLFLGMNPGPWGMAQTGIPFGEIAAVRDWMGIECPVSKPKLEHPARPIEGFACTKSEVSGRRLWGLFSDQWPSAEAFFANHYVLNYCPLSFMSERGSNVTPDKLPITYRKDLERICDAHLAETVKTLNPELLVGIGGFAKKCFERVKKQSGLPQPVGVLLHPSPASPIANRDWPQRPLEQLKELGIL